jgi:branched-chain amino acid transport system substrate-binding protein
MKKRAILLVLLLSFSCTAGSRDEPRSAIAVTESEELLTEIRTYSFEGEKQRIRKTGNRFLSRFGGDPAATEVRLLVATVDVELGFFNEAKRLAEEVIAGDAGEREQAEAQLVISDVEQAKGRFGEAAERVFRVLDMELDDRITSEARESLGRIVDLLTPEQQDELVNAHTTSNGIDVVLESRLSYAEAVGDTAAVRRLVERLGTVYAERPGTSLEPSGGKTVPVTPLQPAAGIRKIGILCPLIGRFSPLGEAFLRGASLAVKEALKRGSAAAELVVGDTRGNPLTARSAAERLIQEEHVIAIVGAVLSSPTVAAAQVAQYRGTVLVSPVATEERISDIGEWIFQTSSDADVEIIAVARMACRELGLKRIAFLSVDDARSRLLERRFSEEVESLGGLISAAEFYEEGSTDFRDTLDRIRRSSPEGLFIASDADDLVLILPQLSYYEFGVQLLGTSAWHSRRLLRMSGRDMEGAIFPELPTAKQDEQLCAAAADYVGEPYEEFNAFVVGGYKGVRAVLEAISMDGTDKDALRRTMSTALEYRRHPYLEFVSEGPGITFYTVVNEKIEVFLTEK